MSSGGLDDARFAWDHQIYRYIFLSGLVVLLYDHLLTFGSEVNNIWSCKRRRSKYWFFAIRYITLGCNVPILVFYFGDLSPKSCSAMEKVLEGLVLVQEAFVDSTLGARVFALYGFNRWVMVSMLSTNLIAAGLGLWTIIVYGNPEMLTAPGLSGCHTAVPRSTALRLVGTWEGQLAYDLLVFGLTAHCAYRNRSTMQHVRGSLMGTMARDGTMYFGIIVLANLSDVLTLYIIISGILSWWTASISVTLILRLNLNLHHAEAVDSGIMDYEIAGLDSSPQNPMPGSTENALVQLENV